MQVQSTQGLNQSALITPFCCNYTPHSLIITIDVDDVAASIDYIATEMGSETAQLTRTLHVVMKVNSI